MSFLDTFSQYKTIESLFLDKDFSSLIGSIGMDAAKQCLIDFQQIDSPKERRKLVRSMINHFELADAAYKKVVSNKMKSVVRTKLFELIEMKRRFIWANIAICEKYLGNEERMNIALKRIQTVSIECESFEDSFGNNVENEVVFGILICLTAIPIHLLEIINPITYIDWIKRESSRYKYEFNISKFQKELKNKEPGQMHN